MWYIITQFFIHMIKDYTNKIKYVLHNDYSLNMNKKSFTQHVWLFFSQKIKKALLYWISNGLKATIQKLSPKQLMKKIPTQNNDAYIIVKDLFADPSKAWTLSQEKNNTQIETKMDLICETRWLCFPSYWNVTLGDWSTRYIFL